MDVWNLYQRSAIPSMNGVPGYTYERHVGTFELLNDAVNFVRAENEGHVSDDAYVGQLLSEPNEATIYVTDFSEPYIARKVQIGTA